MGTSQEEATKSLARIQNFDPSMLARTTDFGTSFNFSSTVPPATRLVRLYQQVSLSILQDLPSGPAEQIRQHADSLYSIFDQILTFSIESQNNPAAVRQQLTNQLEGAYDGTWSTLSPYISYSAAKSADFQRLEREGRAAIQSINDRTGEMLQALESAKQQADDALSAARRAAAEQGVSQQAIYFRDEARSHDEDAEKWRKQTLGFAAVLGAYAALTLFLHKWDWLKPTTPGEAAQLITSKVLIFAVLSYVLLLAARNFLSHKHNAIVNRHRQNALMTFNALAAAAKGPDAKDIILTHAAACIFAPQETGYAKPSPGSADPSLARAVVGLVARSEGRADTAT